MAYGASGHLGIAREATWGTPVAVSSGDFVYAYSENIPLAIDRFEVKNIVGARSEPDDVAGLRRIEGELVIPGYPYALPHFLRGVTNSGSLTVVLSGFLHKYSFFTPATDASTLSPMPSSTLEVFRDVTSAFRVAGAVFQRMQFSVQPNQDLRFTFGVVAKTQSIVAKSTPTYPGSPQDPFTWDTASLSVAGGGFPTLEAMTGTIDSQLEAIPALNNTVEPAFIRARGPQLVNLTATLGFDNLTEYNNFVNQTEQRFVLSLFKAQSFQAVFDFPRVIYTAFPVSMPGRERIMVAMEGKARYHTGSLTAYQIDVTTFPRSGY